MRSLYRSVAWNVVTRIPVVERLVQPVPGRPGWVRIAVSGLAFTMPDHRWWKTFAGGWEADTFRVYRELIRPGDSVVDVGAWIGPTLMFACACRAGRMLAIEPNPACRPYLDALTTIPRPAGSEIVLCTVGVDAIAGESDFGLPDGREITARASGSLFSCGLRIPVAPLPELLARHCFASPDFVKIDIEGAEFVIAGQIAGLAGQPGIRIFLSLHPPLVPAGIDKGHLIEALRSYDLYDARLEPISHEAVTARIHSDELAPGWGTPYGNFFEIVLAPAGEPLRKAARQRPAASSENE